VRLETDIFAESPTAPSGMCDFCFFGLFVLILAWSFKERKSALRADRGHPEIAVTLGRMLPPDFFVE
jgi:hypothetical protein